MQLLEVRNLDVAYGESKALFDVSLSVNTGEIAFIVGRNGAGKTTLLKTVSGFLKPKKGSVIFAGRDITSMPPSEVARLGIRYVHQDKKVFSDLTVKENLLLAAYVTKNYDWNYIFEIFPKLKPLLDRRGGQLSGGERQMLMIARALLGNPTLLMLDEPMEGLAPYVIEALMVAIKKISERTALLMVEQNLRVVSELADKVYVMKEGKITYETNDKLKIKDLVFERFT